MGIDFGLITMALGAVTTAIARASVPNSTSGHAAATA
jgi:hypothetical protein